MDDRTETAAAVTPHLAGRAAPPEEPVATLKVGGANVRIDGPHALPVAEVQTRSAQGPSQALNFVDPAQLLLQAGQLAMQMQSRWTELERREQEFAEWQIRLERDQGDFERHIVTQQTEMEERQAARLASETALARRMSSLDDELQSLESQLDVLESAKRDIDEQRAELRREIDSELAHERAELARQKSLIAAEQARLQELADELLGQQQQALDRVEERLRTEREQLWQTLTAEWETHRKQFEAEQTAWESSRAERDRDLRTRESTLSEREATAARLQSEGDSLRRQYEALLSRWDEDLAELRHAWEQEHQTARQQSEKELVDLRQNELDAIEVARGEWETLRQNQWADLQKERQLLESRIRFQQEHLEKSRHDMERDQLDFRRERQLELQRWEELERQNQRRVQQLDLYRLALEEREKSVARERDAISRQREAISSETHQERLEYEGERIAWEEDRRIQQAELKRREEALTLQSENIELRRLRLEKLRSELEETHRATLELRLSVEEAWVKLVQPNGDEPARVAVESARADLQQYYRQLHDDLIEQRRDLLETQARFERLRVEFQDERQTLTNWISERDEHLRHKESLVRQQSSELNLSEIAWKQSRDQWLQEKLEAETVIRRLLTELTDRHRLAPDDISLEHASPAELDRQRVFEAADPAASAEGLPAPHWRWTESRAPRDA
jgi:hypothetical protein